MLNSGVAGSADENFATLHTIAINKLSLNYLDVNSSSGFCLNEALSTKGLLVSTDTLNFSTRSFPDPDMSLAFSHTTIVSPSFNGDAIGNAN